LALRRRSKSMICWRSASTWELRNWADGARGQAGLIGSRNMARGPGAAQNRCIARCMPTCAQPKRTHILCNPLNPLERRQCLGRRLGPVDRRRWTGCALLTSHAQLWMCGMQLCLIVRSRALVVRVVDVEIIPLRVIHRPPIMAAVQPLLARACAGSSSRLRWPVPVFRSYT
jgi:hypothetical protein